MLFFRRHPLRLPSLLHRTTAVSAFPKLQSCRPSSSDTSNPSEANKSSSLSARMSFVFDQIDAIEKERSQKDETLQRIRSWRESKRNKDGTTEQVDHPQLERDSPDSTSSDSKLVEFNSRKTVELVHPWPEWIELMERLVQQNYFDHKRKDENKMVENLGFDMPEIKEEAFDFIKDWKTVQTACLNFGKDRFDILRSISRQDIQVLVGYGCASTDKKVVFSSKLLRKLVHLNEGDVCSSCNLRSSCERGYLLTNKEDEARTIDIMRVLQVYGFDPLNGSVVNESLLKKKTVKTVVRKLIHEVVKLSAVPIDPNLPPPVIKKPPPKVKIPPPPPRRRVGRDDIEMKKGDWLCPKCDFMNFAKNSACLQCDASRPKRQLLPGEWECPGCNFLNYRRNMACFHCDHKRPPDEFTENQMQEKQHGPRPMRSDNKIPNKSEISNAWNFDFDDNESDGADVATFEHADSRLLDQDFPREERTISAERGYSVPVDKQPGIGFNDFDDEDDDDDLESYEVDTRNNTQKTSSVDFSELEVDSESDDSDGRTRSSNPGRRKVKDEIAFNSDDELPIHPNWKSSHVANSGNRARNRKSGSGSEDDEDEFQSRQNSRGNVRGGRRAMNNYDVPFSDSDSDEEDSGFRGGRGNKVGMDKRRNSFKGRENFEERGGSQFRSRSSDFGGNDDFGDRGGSQFRPRSKGFGGNDDYNERRNSSPRRGSFGDKRGGRSGNFDNRGGRCKSGRSDSFENGRSKNFDDRGGRSTSFEGGKSRSFDDGGGRSRSFEGGKSRSFDDRGGKSRSFGNRGGRSNNFDSGGGKSRNYDKRGSKDSYVAEDIPPMRPRINVR